MKRHIALVAFALLVFSAADVGATGAMVTVPQSQDGSPVTQYDYAGVDYATAAFNASTNSVLMFAGEGVLVGAIVSSNTSSQDYLLFRATNSAVDMETSQANELFRVYLPTNTFGTSDGTMQSAVVPKLGSIIKFNPPIRIKTGVTGRLVGTMVNSIIYLFNKFSER